MSTAPHASDCTIDAPRGAHSSSSTGSLSHVQITPDVETGIGAGGGAGGVRFARYWSLANPDTLSILPIRAWVKMFLAKSRASVDPFARNCRLARWRNDLNPETEAEYHLDALEFLTRLKSDGLRADLCIFDPPYSRYQTKECYDGIGRHYGQSDTANHTGNWRVERDALDEIMEPGGIVLSFGWNSAGMTRGRGYLRHAYATHCLNAGQNPRAIQQAMGHAQLETTMGYLHAEALGVKSPLGYLP